MIHQTFRYHLWNFSVTSDFDLGDLDRAGSGIAADHMSVHRVEQSDCAQPSTPPLFEDYFENGDVWFSSWQISDDVYLIRFPGSCAFRIFPEKMRIDCAPESDIDNATIAHLTLDHAIPRLLSLTPGFVVLHACAFQIENQVVAVLGQSGQGKSTLAGWFASQGFPLLTDDCLVVRWDKNAGQWLAQPSYHSVRLWPDSVDALGIPSSKLRAFSGYSSKRRTGREVDFRFASAGAPLSACFLLPEQPSTSGPVALHSGPPRIRPLSVNEAFLGLARSVFRVDVDNQQLNRREFEVLTSLTASVRFWSLEYERKYDWLPIVQAAMIKAIEDPSEKDQR